MPKTFRFGGIEADVVSEAEGETADWVICVPWEVASVFTDDVRATCFKCGRAVRHRPYAPKRPPKLCCYCLETVLNAPRPN